jgi:hypothetical protein
MHFLRNVYKQNRVECVYKKLATPRVRFALFLKQETDARKQEDLSTLLTEQRN